MDAIRKVGVIGAGVMGSGIAAQVANAGLPVLLLDIVPEGAKNRNALAEGAVDRLLKADPAAFMTKRAARLVETGNVEDDLDRLAECDWIIEAIIERLEAKQALYRRIDAVRVSERRFIQYLHDSAADAHRGHARELQAGFPDHAFLQSAALYAAA